jgi:hypothetical protein
MKNIAKLALLTAHPNPAQSKSLTERKPVMKRLAPLFPAIVLSILSLLGLPTPGRAANYITSTNEPAQASGWNYLIWFLSGNYSLTPVENPSSGNTYEVQANTVPLGSLNTSARVREPTSGSTTFPGDSLQLDTNGELRLKGGLALSFPGVSGNPGLILNGGAIGMGDAGKYALSGVINVAAQSYIAAGNNTSVGDGYTAPVR